MDSTTTSLDVAAAAIEVAKLAVAAFIGFGIENFRKRGHQPHRGCVTKKELEDALDHKVKNLAMSLTTFADTQPTIAQHMGEASRTLANMSQLMKEDYELRRHDAVEAAKQLDRIEIKLTRLDSLWSG